MPQKMTSCPSQSSSSSSVRWNGVKMKKARVCIPYEMRVVADQFIKSALAAASKQTETTEVTGQNGNYDQSVKDVTANASVVKGSGTPSISKGPSTSAAVTPTSAPFVCQVCSATFLSARCFKAHCRSCRAKEDKSKPTGEKMGAVGKTTTLPINIADIKKEKEEKTESKQVIKGPQVNVKQEPPSEDPSTFDTVDVDFKFLLPEVYIGGEDSHSQANNDSLQSDSQQDSKYICQVCQSVGVDRSFARRLKYLQHLRYHKSTGRAILNPVGNRKGRHPIIPYADSYTCSTCEGRAFTERKRYRDHMKWHARLKKKTGHDRPVRCGKYASIPYADSYTCSTCEGRIFTERKQFLSHLRSHEDQKKKTGHDGPVRPHGNRGGKYASIPYTDSYTCSTCEGRIFTERKQFVSHLRSHEDLKKKTGHDGPLRSRITIHIPLQDVYTCSVTECNNRSFADRKLYREHLKWHRKKEKKTHKTEKRKSIPEQGEYTCPTCGKFFSVKSSFRSHMRNHERTEREKARRLERIQKMRPDIPIQDVYHCNRHFDDASCVRTFHSRLQFINHVRQHEKLEKMGADRPILDKSAFERDDSDGEDEDEARNYYCKVCDRRFSSKRVYKGHVNYHSFVIEKEGKDRPIAVTPVVGDWRSRIPHDDNYNCKICPNRSFTNRDHFISHLTMHRQLKRKSGSNRPIMTKEEWNRRYQGKSQSQDYKCTQCDKLFRIKRLLREHQSHHRKVKKAAENWRESIPYQDSYNCETCPSRQFSSRESYIGHLMYHRNLKRQGCDRIILTKEEVAHLPRVRRQSLFCSMCDKKFSRRSTFVGHLKRHQALKKRGIEVIKRKNWKDEIPYQETYVCQMCPTRLLPSRKNYINHLAYHKALERKCQTRNNILSQETLENLPDGEAYSCSEEGCEGKTFPSRLKYMAHKVYHQRVEKLGISRKRKVQKVSKKPKQKRELKCQMCDRTFPNLKIYRNHRTYHYQIRKKEGRDRPIKVQVGEPTAAFPEPEPESGVYHCPICEDREFTERKKYSTHMRYHRRSEKKRGLLVPTPVRQRRETSDDIVDLPLQYTCRCGQSFHFLDALDYHLKLNLSSECGVAKEEQPRERPINENAAMDAVIAEFDAVAAAVLPSAENISHPNSLDIADDDNNSIEVFTISDSDTDDDERDEEIENEEQEELITIDDSDDEVAVCVAEEEIKPALVDTKKNVKDIPLVTDMKEEAPRNDIPVAAVIPQATVPKEEPMDPLSDAYVMGAEPMEEDDDDDVVDLYKCTICAQHCSSLTDYLRHQFLNHRSTQRLACPFCIQQFEDASGLFGHCHSCHSIIETIQDFYVPCSICELEVLIRNGQEMNEHLKSTHPDLVCRLCSTTFYDQDTLNAHFLSRHARRRSNPAQRPVIVSIAANSGATDSTKSK